MATLNMFTVSATMLLCAAVLLQLTVSSHAAECHSHPDPNAQPNTNAIMTGAPVLVKSIKNAKLFHVGEGDDMIDVVHLWGTPYEMGFAHGSICNTTATALLNGVWEYLESQVESAINGSVHHLKPAFVELVADVGLNAALDLEVLATEKYTPSYFNEELQGMADATGLPFKKLQYIHMIGELTKGDCSMYGAWGNATASTGSNLMQLRALDWDVDGPFKDYPQVAVYHPNGDNGHAFANIAWSGFIGSITGMSSQQMAISEIGVAFPDASFGKESRFGIPFTYILRDVLQFDTSVEDTQKRFTEAHRTCNLILGAGDGKAKQFRSIQYSASVANFMTDTDMMPVNDTWHPRMNDVVYYGMDWLCPAFNAAMHKQLVANYGKITPENTIRDIVPIVQTGNLHVAIYDLTNMVLHLANARKSGSSGPEMAFDRAFIRMDMNAIFAVHQD